MTLTENHWPEDFYTYLRQEKNYSEKTLSAYRVSLVGFECFFCNQDSSLTWSTITSDNVRDWMMERMDEGYKSTTVALGLSAVKSFYRFLLVRGYISKDVTYLVKGPKVEKSLPRFIPEDDMQQLFEKVVFTPDYIGQRDRLVLTILYATGIRAAELIGLDLSGVDLGLKQIKVLGKRNKERIVPISNHLCEMIGGYLRLRNDYVTSLGCEDTGSFFLSKRGQRIRYAHVWKIVTSNLSLITDQKKKSPHVLRHSFATSMLNNEADLQSVKELLGHESLSTTEIYTHVLFEDLKSAYKKAHPRE